MGTRKNKAELEAELKFVKKSRLAEGVVKVIITGLRCATMVLIFFFIHLMVKELSGKSTNSNIFIKFVTDFKVNEWFAYCIAGAGTLYGLGQRQLRKNYISRNHSRTQKLELQIDKRRTSSKLTERGDTRPEDK